MCRLFLVRPEKCLTLPTQTEGSKKSHEVIGLRCGSSDAFLIFYLELLTHYFRKPTMGEHPRMALPDHNIACSTHHKRMVT